MQEEVIFEDLGIMQYGEAWKYQEDLLNSIAAAKTVSNAKTSHYLLFVEHNHVYTLGKNGAENNLLINNEQLKLLGIEFYNTNRGGDITYHGPGQIVCYPIFNLSQFNIGIKQYVNSLEEVIIKLNALYNIETHRVEHATGVWTRNIDNIGEQKVCAIGVRVSRGITMHGLALNVNTDLSYYNMINPCGFASNSATSMQKILNKNLDILEVKDKLKAIFAEEFNFKYASG